MIKLNVVNLIVCLCLESLENNLVLLIADLELHGVEDGSEAGVGNESALALVLVLEEGLNPETLVAHEPSQALQASLQHLLFFIVQHILRVKNRRCIEHDSLLQRILLKVLQSEDLFNSLIEFNVVNFSRIARYSKVTFKNLEFFICQVDLLGEKNTSEFLRSYDTLSEDIVILEELSQTDSILLGLSLKLEEECINCLLSNKCSFLSNILVFLCLAQLVNLLLVSLERCAIINEFHVLDFILISAIDLLESL